MAKFSKKVMGKAVGSAEVYAQPNTMTGNFVRFQGCPFVQNRSQQHVCR